MRLEVTVDLRYRSLGHPGYRHVKAPEARLVSANEIKVRKSRGMFANPGKVINVFESCIMLVNLLHF